MSLPTSKAPAAQLSIRSFFQAKGPKYTPPPPSSSSTVPPQRDAAGSSSPNASSSSSSSSRQPPSPPPSNTQAAASTSSADPPPQPHDTPLPRPTVDAPLPPPPTNLPPEACIRLVSVADADALRRINSLLLPVSYPDYIYRNAADPAESGRFSRVITWAHDGREPRVVGGIVCRVESAPGRAVHKLYIQSLCLLSPYRGLGLMGAALDNAVATAVADPNLDVRTVTAHVWTENEEGLHWYDARGFKRAEHPIPGYYFKLRPQSAWLVERTVGASVRPSLPSPPAASPAPTHPVTCGPPAAVANLASSATSGTPPPPKSGTSTPSSVPSRGQSYQNQRPETEWNDLPADMAPGLLAPPHRPGSGPASGASSRSSSTVRKKRDRSYPAAAFGAN